MAAITPNPQLIEILAALAAGDYDALTMDLYQNDLDPTPLTVLGDFTVATYSGYAQKTALAFGTPYFNPDGIAEMDLPSQQFDHSGGAVANNIYGYYVQKTGGGLLYAERLPDAPYPMIDATNSIVILSRFLMRNFST